MKIVVPLLLTLALAGCASVAVTQTALEERTAFALNAKPEDLTISNRQDSGVRTDYQVQTRQGAQYRCYVTGTIGYTGREVSDAMCNQTAGPGGKPVAAGKVGGNANPASCNAQIGRAHV